MNLVIDIFVIILFLCSVGASLLDLITTLSALSVNKRGYLYARETSPTGVWKTMISKWIILFGIYSTYWIISFSFWPCVVVMILSFHTGASSVAAISNWHKKSEIELMNNIIEKTLKRW